MQVVSSNIRLLKVIWLTYKELKKAKVNLAAMNILRRSASQAV